MNIENQSGSNKLTSHREGLAQLNLNVEINLTSYSKVREYLKDKTLPYQHKEHTDRDFPSTFCLENILCKISKKTT